MKPDATTNRIQQPLKPVRVQCVSWLRFTPSSAASCSSKSNPLNSINCPQPNHDTSQTAWQVTAIDNKRGNQSTELKPRHNSKDHECAIKGVYHSIAVTHASLCRYFGATLTKLFPKKTEHTPSFTSLVSESPFKPKFFKNFALERAFNLDIETVKQNHQSPNHKPRHTQGLTRPALLACQSPSNP